MLKIILMIILIINTDYVYAGWSEIAADNIATEFVNLETVERKGNISKMWNMSNFKSKQPVGNGQFFQSTKAQQEYDCLTNKKRIVSIIHYVGAMGKGQVAFLDVTSRQWRKVLRGSLGQAHLNAACVLIK
jgi:hypothetical protein